MPAFSRLRTLPVALALLALAACGERPGDAEIAALLEASANRELTALRLGSGGQGLPEALRIVNLETLGGVSDSADVYVVSVRFDLMVEIRGTRTLTQRHAKARLKLAREGGAWRIVEKK